MIYMPYLNYTEVKCLHGKQLPRVYLSQENIITTPITNVRKERRNENQRTSTEP